jgi:hypothetical protein
MFNELLKSLRWQHLTAGANIIHAEPPAALTMLGDFGRHLT